MNLKPVKSRPTEPQTSQQTAQYLNSSVVKTSILLEGSCVLGMEITPQLFLAVLHCCPTGSVTTHTDICGCQSSGTLQPTAGRHRGIACLFPNVNASILWKKACGLSVKFMTRSATRGLKSSVLRLQAIISLKGYVSVDEGCASALVSLPDHCVFYCTSITSDSNYM